MKNKYVFVAVMLSSIVLVSTLLTSIYVRRSENMEGEKLEETLIVTSFYPMYIATENVVEGIEGIRLENLSEPQTGCLHDFQMTPADMKLLSQADVFVVNGGGIESFLSDVAKAYPQLTIIEASEGISLMEDAEDHDHVAELNEDAEEGQLHERHEEEVEVNHFHEDHEEEEEDSHFHEDYEEEEEDRHSHERHEETGHAHEEHNHGEENAHAWMSVASYREQVKNIENALAVKLPQYQESLQANAKTYDEKLADLQGQQETLRQMAEGTHVVLFHEAYAYVARDYGMEVSFVLDLDEERQVSAGEVAEVLSAIEKEGATLILAEERYGRDMAETIQGETDVAVAYLDTLNRGNYDKDSYLAGMQKNMDLLKQILKGGNR